MSTPAHRRTRGAEGISRPVHRGALSGLWSKGAAIAWLGALAAAVVFSALVAPHLFHARGWWIFGDLSSMLRASDLVARTGLVHVYDAPGALLVALPGFEEIVALPLVILRAFGLSYSVGAVLVHGTFTSQGEWSLTDHITVVVAFGLGLATIFPIDALARDMGLRGARRATALVAASAILVWAIARWGHPDDMLAIGLLLTSLRCAYRGRWPAAAWLLGGAFAVQPLSALGAFVVLGVTHLPWRRWGRFIVRVAILPLLVIVVPLVGETKTTLHRVLGQPVEWGTAVTTNHATPWHALVLGVATISIPHRGLIFEGDGSDVRMLAVALAVLLGWWVARQGHALRLETALWALGFGLAGRIFFESVIIPYYLAPPLLLGMLLVTAKSKPWALAGGIVAAATAWVGSVHILGEWGYLLAVSGGLIALFALGWHRSTGRALDTRETTSMSDKSASFVHTEPHTRDLLVR